MVSAYLLVSDEAVRALTAQSTNKQFGAKQVADKFIKDFIEVKEQRANNEINALEWLRTWQVIYWTPADEHRKHACPSHLQQKTMYDLDCFFLNKAGTSLWTSSLAPRQKLQTTSKSKQWSLLPKPIW
jgi:hypothetical protein